MKLISIIINYCVFSRCSRERKYSTSSPFSITLIVPDPVWICKFVTKHKTKWFRCYEEYTRINSIMLCIFQKPMKWLKQRNKIGSTLLLKHFWSLEILSVVLGLVMLPRKASILSTGSSGCWLWGCSLSSPFTFHMR